MPIITLTSDYGLIDHRVAAIKGIILTQNENAKIVDITHGITAYNLLQTAYIVRNAFKNFPVGSIHIISVDSFYHKDRKNLLYKVDGHYFLCADNGLMSLIFFDIKPEYIYELTLNNRFDDEINFTSTDIFAPAALHLYKGGLPEVIGRPTQDAKSNSIPRAVYNDKMIIGEVIYVDNFGNVVSNISRKFFEKHASNFENYVIKFRNIGLTNVYNHYTDLISNWDHEHEHHGKSIVVFNENDLLEVAIYKGSLHNGACSLFGMHLGEKIYVEFQ